MAYLDKNGLNYYSQKVSEKIQDVKDDLDELKIIQEEEFEVVDVQWNTSTGVWVWVRFSNHYEHLWAGGSTNPISVNSGEKYFISTYTDASDTPAVILVNNSEIYSSGTIENQYVVATYGNSSLYEGVITIPQNVVQMIVNNTNDNYTPIIKKATKERVKVEKLADANFTTKTYVDGEISSIQTTINTTENQINNLDSKLENLKTIHYEEKEIESTTVTGKSINNLTITTTTNAAYATCEVEAGKTYRISGSSYSTNVPAVIIFSSTEYRSGQYINLFTIINSYGYQQTPYEDTITMPENAKLLLVQTRNINLYPISIINIEKVDKLADVASMDSDVSSMLLEVFNNALTPQELEDLVFLSNVESEVF